ncbi:MAG: transcriptional repressor LexA [Clostridia bacterium]
MEGVPIPSRRDTILKYIARYTQDHGYPPTVREIAHGVGLRSTSTVAYYIRDLEQRGQLDRTRERSRGVVLKDRERPDAVPLVGRIAAGTPILATEQVEDMVTVPAEWFSARVDFALKVVGDSMIGAGIHDGDIAFIHQQPAADDGEIVAALLEDEATLKRLHRRSGRVELHAENPRYAPIIAEDVTILGRLVGIVRTF